MVSPDPGENFTSKKQVQQLMKPIRFLLAIPVICFFSLASLAQSSPAIATASALRAYYGVKDALVATDAAKATIQATTLSAALGNVDAANLSAAGKKALTTAKTQATALSKTADVGEQREHFGMLSTSMITLAKATKPAKAYVQYCPMKNASWLSDKKVVQNPYYGSRMLHCGSVKEEI
jgi:hypothetical protein